MKMQIMSTYYKGFPGLKLSNDLMDAIVIPDQGGKIASLKLRGHSFEFLYQNPSDSFLPAKYADAFTQRECAGIDDIFPTAKPCFCECWPWQGTQLPDHGEVWAQSWLADVQPEYLELQVYGVRLPYRLKKRIWLEGPTLRMHYTAENLSEYHMPYIWMSHMMLNAQEGSRFDVDPTQDRGICIYTQSGRIGSFGREFSFPFVSLPDGSLQDVRIHRGSEVDDYEKFYLAKPVSQGWASVHHPCGRALRIAFPPESVPYLGMIQAEGGELNLRCMFFEPASACFDRLDFARQYGMESVLPPRGAISWFLNITLY